MWVTLDDRPRKPREDLIDSLIAISLLTQRMARNLIELECDEEANREKGGKRHVEDERTGLTAYRAV